MKTRLLSLLLIPLLAHAETGGEDAPPSKAVLQTALAWMQSSDPERRQAAYRSVHLLGEEALPGFKQALQAALKFHEQHLSDLLSGRSGSGNPYRELGTALNELDSERSRIYALILIDYKKDPDKIRMLRTEMDGLTRLYERAGRLSSADPASLDKSVDETALAMAEIRAQLARFDELSYGSQSPDEEPSVEEQKLTALRDSFDGEGYLKDKAASVRFRAELDALAKARSDNKQCDWANSSQKDFTAHLNGERGVVGLPPLRLEERLSAAATGHSNDMRTVGFFDHTSPVEGKTGPGDRARLAGFKGGWSGENIFMGSPAFTAAYSGWFGSDGHRFIMFAKGPTVIGVGPVGNHWTMMTGRL